MGDHDPVQANEMAQAYKNAAARAAETPGPLPVRQSEVSVDEEMSALKQCVQALHPVAHDKALLRRVYDYLQQRFPSGRPDSRGRDSF